MNFTEEFYEGLANFFYAVSMADKNMTVEEKRVLLNELKRTGLIPITLVANRFMKL